MMKALVRFLVFGVVVSAGVGATAIPVSAVPTDHVLGGGSTPASAVSDELLAPTPSASALYQVLANLSPSRVSLTNGKALESHGSESPSWTMTEVREAFDRAGHAFEVRDDNSRPDINAAATWQVTMFGEQTDYWVVARVVMTWNVFSPNTYGECEVYRGDPAFGGTRMDVSPITCTPKRGDRKALYSVVTFDIGLNRWAELSGTVKTLDHISLSHGQRRTGVPRFALPASKLASNDSTEFNAVLLETESNRDFEDQARMEMMYQIVDDGVPTHFAVAAMATNHRGIFRFNPDTSCEIVDLRVPNTPIDEDPYTCLTEGAVVIGEGEDGNGHFRATFTVQRRLFE